jgi:hypothetical protein
MNRITLASLSLTAMLVIACGDDDADDSDGPLSNPDFATNTSGWVVEDPPTATLTWSSVDASGAAGSGSALVTNTSPGASNGSGITQCVMSIAAGANYTFGGKLLYPTGQSRTGHLALGLRWRSAPGCTGSVLGEQPRLNHSTAGAAWVSLTSEVLVAPAGAVSADFVAFPSKIEAGGQLAGNFDDLFITSSSGSNLLLAPFASHPR